MRERQGYEDLLEYIYQTRNWEWNSKKVEGESDLEVDGQVNGDNK